MITVGATEPSYLTIDPTTGLIGADFSGHVHAQGLDLDAGNAGTAPDQDRVRWLRTSDGAAIADLLGWEDVAGNVAVLRLQGTGTAGESGRLELWGAANRPAGADATASLVLDATIGGAGFVNAQASKVGQSRNATLIDANGRSDYLQLAATQRQVLSGPYDTGVLGGAGIPQFNDVNVIVTHNLNTVSLTVWGHLYDGFFSSLAGWRAQPINANQIQIFIGNNSNRAVTAGLHFYLVIG